MKYCKFVIKNYKGIPSIELDLDKKPSSNIFTLVGLNESGKTSILEAIYLFQKSISKVQAHTLIPRDQQHAFSDYVSITASLELEESDLKNIKTYVKNKYQYELTDISSIVEVKKKYNFKKSIPSEDDSWKESLWTITLKGKTSRAKNIKNLSEWSDEAWQDTINYIKGKLLPKILYYPDFLFKFPEKIYLEKYEKEGSEQEEYRSVIGDILESINNDLTVQDDLLDKMKNSEDKAHGESLKQLLLKMSAKLNDEILKKWDAIFGAGQKKEVDINWNKESSAGADGQAVTRYFLELKIKQGSDSYSINDRSLGFRWFFSFLIFTAFRKSRSSDPGETLFLLDEPASNLHQTSQQKLLQSLDDIVSECKLIYSTHSHHLINPKWLSGTYIVKNEAINYGNPEEAKTTETKIDSIPYKNFVAKYPNEENHFKPILDALDYIPSSLEMVSSTVFTEGKNDYYTFKYFAEIIFKGKYNLSFYPGASVSKYEDVFRLYLAWNRHFVALFDSDRQGKREKNRYINTLGPDIIGDIFTLDEVNPRWTDSVTEDLFTDVEKFKVTQLSFPEHKREDGYNKSKFNTALQQLYIDGVVFDFNKTTNDKIETILKYLQEKVEEEK